jgi:hypothetical protein
MTPIQSLTSHCYQRQSRHLYRDPPSMLKKKGKEVVAKQPAHARRRPASAWSAAIHKARATGAAE